MKDVEITLREDDDEVFAISLVEKPAIQSDWVTLSEQTIKMKVVDEDKRIILGAVLIPDKKIPRRVGENEFNIFFKDHTIEKLSQNWMKKMNLGNVTLEHEQFITGVTPVESWVVKDYSCDKAKLFNLDVPNGTWVVAMKVDDDERWKEAKEGKIKGFSIEGRFLDYAEAAEGVKMSEEETLIEKIKQILEQDGKENTGDK
jgi:hypothetical protein